MKIKGKDKHLYRKLVLVKRANAIHRIECNENQISCLFTNVLCTSTMELMKKKEPFGFDEIFGRFNLNGDLRWKEGNKIGDRQNKKSKKREKKRKEKLKEEIQKYYRLESKENIKRNWTIWHFTIFFSLFFYLLFKIWK